MCGIAGHVQFSNRPSQSRVAEIVDRTRHRGPDDFGLWRSPDQTCVLGHTRLSIIDLSPLGHQPMVDAETGNAIVFNGEIYNFQELRRECEKLGDIFRSHSDTEVILVLYRRYGIDCLYKLRGMFAFAIYDERRGRLFFARDRVGKKPFNYACSDQGFIFSSEIDPLVHHPQVERDMDMEALDLYLHLQYIPAPWTIYKSIRKLPPAHYGIYDRNGLRLEKYWDVDYTKKVQISERDALDGLEEKLKEAIRLRMISDVPLGALLSGGVDSSVIVALMAKLSGEPVHTYSIGFNEEAFNELPFAQEAADICGTDHYSKIVEPDFEHLLPKLVRHYGEPYGDASAVPSFIVSQFAHQHVSVVMNGDGGDELLGGYPRYWISQVKLLTASLKPEIFSSSQLVKLTIHLSTVTSIPARAIRKILTEYCWPELRSVGMYSAYWNDNERFDLLNGSNNNGLLNKWREGWLNGARKRGGNNPIDRMLWYDNHTYLPGDLLVKMDIASMHCGLEARSPLLDHELIEYCAAFPLDLKVNNQVGKYALKKLAERYFTKEFVHRPKMGFGIPLRDWLQGPFREILLDTLHDRSAMAPLNGARIEKTLDEMLVNGIDHSSRLWSLLMFGLWQKHTAG